MPTRQINISLTEQVPQERKLYFTPVLTSLDGDLLLEEQYNVTTDEEGVASIDLPVKDSGNIRYDYEVPSSEGGTTTGFFLLEAGDPLDLDELLDSGGVATDNVKQYVDERVAAALATLDATLVHVAGDEEIAGVKTFDSSPIVPAPTEDLQAATKKYVDDNAVVAVPGSCALQFDHTKGHHVEIGRYYTSGHDYNASATFCELWLKPDSLTGGGYHTVENYGGTHILLFGSEGGRIFGNFANGSQDNSYTSKDESPVDGWAHHAILYVPEDYIAAGNPSTAKVATYVNGFLSSVTDLTNPRTNPQGIMEIGGTDHSNWGGRISQWRLFEGGTPFNHASALMPAGFCPPRGFRGGVYSSTGPAGASVAGVSTLFDFRNNTGKTIPDLGIGFNGGTHTGVMTAGYPSVGSYGQIDEYVSNLPQWVTDPVTRPTRAFSIPTPPVGVLFYDSFSRDDVTPAFDAIPSGGSMVLPGPGNLEYPSSVPWGGVQTELFGIINGRLASITSVGANLVVSVGATNQDIRIDSGDTDWDTIPQVLGRYTDTINYVGLYLWNLGANWGMSEIINGNTAQSASGSSTPGASSHLRLVVNGSTATAYLGATQLGTLTGLTLPSGQKAGVRMSNYQRVSEFAVY